MKRSPGVAPCIRFALLSMRFGFTFFPPPWPSLTITFDAPASKQAAMPTGDNAVGPNENPHLELAKQTNVLLGVLVSEIQKLSTKLEKVVEVSPEREDTEEVETPPTPVPNPEDEQKNLIANIQKSHEDLRKRIARISA